MKRFSTFIFLSLLTMSVRAQVAVGYEFTTGYSSYTMADLRDVTKNYQNNVDYPVRITNNFPAFISFGGNAFVSIAKWDLGLGYTYYSSGARAHYADYSGEMGLDQILRGNAINVFGRYNFFERGPVKLHAQLALSRYGSKLNLKEYARVGATNDETELDVVSTSMGGTALIGASYKIHEYFLVGLRIGLYVDSTGGLHLRDDADVKLTKDNGDEVTTDWSGFRSEVFLACRLPMTK